MRGVHVIGSHAFLAAGGAGLLVVDISNPAAPLEVGSYDTGDVARDVVVKGDHAYVADRIDGLRVINISDPATPFEEGFYQTPTAIGAGLALRSF